MQAKKTHVKTIKATGINGTITVEGDQLLVDVELQQSYWGTKFLILPWMKKRIVKHKLVRSRNGNRFTSATGRFDEDDFDPVMLSVLFELANDSFVEYDDVYPEEVLDEVELSDGETFDVVEEIAGATSYEHVEVGTTDESTEEITIEESNAQDLNEILAETEAEIVEESRSAPEPAYSAPEPVYQAPESTYRAPEPVYSAPEPAPSYSAPEPTRSPEPSYSAPSYDSSSSSSSSDSGGGSCD